MKVYFKTKDHEFDLAWLIYCSIVKNISIKLFFKNAFRKKITLFLFLHPQNL